MEAVYHNLAYKVEALAEKTALNMPFDDQEIIIKLDEDDFIHVCKNDLVFRVINKGSDGWVFYSNHPIELSEVDGMPAVIAAR